MRRMRADSGDTKEPYLSLSVRGAPLYSVQVDANTFNEANTLRHSKIGQGESASTSNDYVKFSR